MFFPYFLMADVWTIDFYLLLLTQYFKQSSWLLSFLIYAAIIVFPHLSVFPEVSPLLMPWSKFCSCLLFFLTLHNQSSSKFCQLGLQNIPQSNHLSPLPPRALQSTSLFFLVYIILVPGWLDYLLLLLLPMTGAWEMCKSEMAFTHWPKTFSLFLSHIG